MICRNVIQYKECGQKANVRFNKEQIRPLKDEKYKDMTRLEYTDFKPKCRTNLNPLNETSYMNQFRFLLFVTIFCVLQYLKLLIISFSISLIFLYIIFLKYFKLMRQSMNFRYNTCQNSVFFNY
jgi:hypothetical protein